MKVYSIKITILALIISVVINHSPKGFSRNQNECVPPKTPKMNFFLQEFTDCKFK